MPSRATHLSTISTAAGDNKNDGIIQLNEDLRRNTVIEETPQPVINNHTLYEHLRAISTATKFAILRVPLTNFEA